MVTCKNPNCQFTLVFSRKDTNQVIKEWNVKMSDLKTWSTSMMDFDYPELKDFLYNMDEYSQVTPTFCEKCKEKLDRYPKFDEKLLVDADPNCRHEIVDASGGGVKCKKCNGWFCF